MSGYATTKKWRDEFKARDPQGYRKYRAEEAAKWRKNHPDTSRKIIKKYRELHLVEIRKRDAENQANWRKKNPELQRLRALKFKVKQEKIREQIAGRPRANVCELCAAPEKTVFDHNHKTGTFRGWICDRCNKVLGLVYDSTELLEKMILYLEK